MWVPSRRWGWGGCGCWRWPSPAAGGHPAARVRRCEAASAAPRPETLTARASATSSSTVGAGAGRGMKARGPIPRPLPPRLAWGAGSREPAAARLGTSPSSPALPAWPAAAPIAASRNRGMRLWPAPVLLLPRSLSAPPPVSGCILHLKDRFPNPPRTNECADDSSCCQFRDPSRKEASFARSVLSLIVYTKAP